MSARRTVTVALWVFVFAIFAALFFGYMVGKDRALRDNAIDSAKAAR